MTNFIEFRKEYLLENPGSSMTIIRNAYYKETGKDKPLKTSRKTSRKKSRKTSRKTSRKKSRKTSRKKSRKTSRKTSRKKSRKKTQTGGEKTTDLNSVTKSLSQNIQLKTNEIYDLDNSKNRSDMIEIANLIQDQSFNINNINIIKNNTNIDEYDKLTSKLNTFLKRNYNKLNKLSDKTLKTSNTNLKLLEKVDINDGDISKLKANIKNTTSVSKELSELTEKFSRIIKFIENEFD